MKVKEVPILSGPSSLLWSGKAMLLSWIDCRESWIYPISARLLLWSSCLRLWCQAYYALELFNTLISLTCALDDYTRRLVRRHGDTSSNLHSSRQHQCHTCGPEDLSVKPLPLLEKAKGHRVAFCMFLRTQLRDISMARTEMTSCVAFEGNNWHQSGSRHTFSGGLSRKAHLLLEQQRKTSFV